MRKLTKLFKRAKRVFQTQGLIPLLRKGFRSLLACSFRYERYYCYKRALTEINDSEFIPRNKDFTLKIISKKEEIDDLIADGYDFSWFTFKADRWLSNGAIAFCAFVGRKLIHMSWLAMNEPAKRSLDDSPYPVDFSSKEAFIGWTAKNPRYLRASLGIPVYVYIKSLQFLKQQGFTAAKYLVKKRNTINQQVIDKRVGDRPYGEARYIKILG